MSNCEYTPVPSSNVNLEIERVSSQLDAAELILLKRATRWVGFLCFIQTVSTFSKYNL